MTTWLDAQTEELHWWGDCANTFDEEQMQLLAAPLMGLEVNDRAQIVTEGDICDIGGGPVSLLLKAQGWRTATVVDPGAYPWWTLGRYEASGIRVVSQPGEIFLAMQPAQFDEVWIYNVLQHVADPEALVNLACRRAPVVRLFEWIEFETNEAHIHTLIASEIEGWANDAGYRVKEGGVTSLTHRGEDNLCFPAVFIAA